MIQKIDPVTFIKERKKYPVIDVRSPGEFIAGHIPHSQNLPLFSDEERAEIGTIYKHRGREQAVLRGLEIVGPKMADFVRKAGEIGPNKTIILHCWRGGMRSGSMAWLLQTGGFECQVLEGGYKAFRKAGKDSLSKPVKAYIIGGFTGSWKTKVLWELQKLDEQVLDIEKIARHRGSSFGSIGQEAQKSNEQFENELILEWLSFDLSRRIWIEDESRILGSNHLPDSLYELIRKSKVFKLNIPLDQRANHLVEDYAHLEKNQLEQAIRRIERKLGGQHMQLAINALEVNDYKTVAGITLNYYDKTYSYGLSKRSPETILEVPEDLVNPADIARYLVQRSQNLEFV